MIDDRVLARIDAWLAAGLIDEATAARLREAEGSAQPDATAGGGRGPGALASMFGPAVAVGEAFAYLGATFLLAAWHTFVDRSRNVLSDGNLVTAAGMVVAAAVLAGLGLAIRRRSPRLGRAAGVALLAATAHLGVATSLVVLPLTGPTNTIAQVAGAAAGLAVALGFRRLHPALLTQAGLVGAVIVLASTLMQWLEVALFAPPVFDAPPSVDTPLRVALMAGGWGATAVVLGLIGLREARRAEAPAAARASLTRLAAGLVAVLGVASAITMSGPLAGGEYGRLVPPVVGDLALLAIAAVLLERAFRRDAAAYVVPAGLGVVIALTDLNASYLAAALGLEAALVVEGGILLAAGLAADRVRRRLGRGRRPAVPEPDLAGVASSV